MPSKTDARRGGAKQAEPDDLDNYFLEEDFEDDPFGSPGASGDTNKRKEPEGLGIDEEVSVQKRARVPRVKLDETRLLSENGIPKLRKRAVGLKLKGKGHEFSDAARLLSFYQLWLDDLFPKAKFLDALAMVEKAGHKKTMHKVRMDWINEGKPTANEDVIQETQPTAAEGTNATSAAKPGQSGSLTTPAPDDLFGEEEDIYNATPQRPGQTKSVATGPAIGGGEPDEDDLDALMAEAEVNGQSGPSKPDTSSNRPQTSIFGPARPKGAPLKPAPLQHEEDDLDALMAEAEANDTALSRPKSAEKGSAAIAEKSQANPSADAEDDLDALMAEEENHSNLAKDKPTSTRPNQPQESFADDEEAMAEMDGLW